MAITSDVHQSKDDECGSEMTSASATPTIKPETDHKKVMIPKKLWLSKKKSSI